METSGLQGRSAMSVDLIGNSQQVIKIFLSFRFTQYQIIVCESTTHLHFYIFLFLHNFILDLLDVMSVFFVVQIPVKRLFMLVCSCVHVLLLASVN